MESLLFCASRWKRLDSLNQVSIAYPFFGPACVFCILKLLAWAATVLKSYTTKALLFLLIWVNSFFFPGRFCRSSGGDPIQSIKWARCTIQWPDISSHNKLVKRANSACKRISLYLPRFALRSLFYQLQVCWLYRLDIIRGMCGLQRAQRVC